MFRCFLEEYIKGYVECVLEGVELTQEQLDFIADEIEYNDYIFQLFDDIIYTRLEELGLSKEDDDK